MGLPTTDRFIAEAERHLRYALPAWLRLRLLKENGGTVESSGEYWELFSVFDTTDRKHITRSATHIVSETATARQWPGFPPTAIAIARNGGGDYLILVADPGDPTELLAAAHRWLHGSDEPPEPVDVSVDADAT